jgi:hypothetical protein
MKSIIIYPAQQLTLPAQNALLKTLEEPPLYVQIYLIIKNQDQLLPTILSRCEVKYLPSNSTGQVYPPLSVSPEIKNLVTSLDTSSIGKRLILTDIVAINRESALIFCTELINYLRAKNLRQPSRERSGQLKNTQEAITHLLGNANPRLTLEHLFLHWQLP